MDFNGDAGNANGNKKKVNEEDLKTAESKLNDEAKSNGFAEAFYIMKDFISLCWDYLNGDYTDLPLASFLAISFAIIYFISPIDAIPDWIPMAGYLDDAGIVMSVYKFVKDDVEMYRAWKKKQNAA